MGDRGNIVMEFKNKDRIYFYSHWGGSELPGVVHHALGRRLRWDDPPYLARIIFCSLVKGQESGETGYGISPGICDNEHSLLVVDTENNRIRYHHEGENLDGKPYVEFSYESFLKLSEEEVTDLFNDPSKAEK